MQDPYVEVTLLTKGGDKGDSAKTKTKDNAGSSASFNEELTLTKKAEEVSKTLDETISAYVLRQHAKDHVKHSYGKILAVMHARKYFFCVRW
jgi:hypothetical protein